MRGRLHLFLTVTAVNSFVTDMDTSTRGRRVGYVRVSSYDQNPERQLEDVPVERTFTDKASENDTNRPRLQALTAFVRARAP